MKAKELIRQIQENLDSDAEVDFLVIGRDDFHWLNLYSINMSADVDPEFSNMGALVFYEKEVEM